MRMMRRCPAKHPRPRWLAHLAWPALVIALSGCAEILGIEPWEEHYPPDAGTGGIAGSGAEGGTGGAGGSGGTAGAGGEIHHYPWARRFGDEENEHASAVGVDADGNVWLTGMFQGDIDFDGTTSNTLDSTDDIFLVKLDADGHTTWTTLPQAPLEQSSRSLAVDRDGSVVMGGHYFGTLNLGGNDLTATGEDIFVGKFHPDGTHLWSKKFGNNGSQRLLDVALDEFHDPAEVVLAGRFAGQVVFGGDTLDSSSVGDLDGFVAKLDADGAALWGRQFGDDTNSQWAAAVAVDDAQNIFIAGTLEGTADIGGPISSHGGTDILLAKLYPAGEGIWARSFGSSANDEAHDVAVDSAGNVVVVGYFNGTVNFGGGSLTSAGSGDLFVAKFNGDADHQWSKSFGDGAASQVAHAVAMDSDDNVVVAGRFGGTIDFGGETLSCTATTNLFLVKLAAFDGAHLASQCWGESGQHIATSVAVASTNEVLFAGYLGQSVAGGGGAGGGPVAGVAIFGEDRLESAGAQDVFVAKFGPSGFGR